MGFYDHYMKLCAENRGDVQAINKAMERYRLTKEWIHKDPNMSRLRLAVCNQKLIQDKDKVLKIEATIGQKLQRIRGQYL